ncbi:MAG: hypothetical protein Q9214_007876, partial [Letrouitia sp. 1 TL-2023]
YPNNLTVTISVYFAIRVRVPKEREVRFPSSFEVRVKDRIKINCAYLYHFFETRKQSTMPQTIEQAFSSQPDLHRQITKTLQTYPSLLPLFSSISTYIQDLKSQNPSSYPITSQPPLKKRKLSFSSPSSATDEKADSISDLSFSIPQRKKLRLDLSRSSATGVLKAINTSTLDPEFGIPYSAIATAICVPVPEKAQPQYNFCILPLENSGHEQILFTVPSTKPKEGVAAVEGGLREDESYKDLVIRLLNARLPQGQL